MKGTDIKTGMRILLTGAKGFIGSHLYTRLSVDNEVHGIDCSVYEEFDARWRNFCRRGGAFDLIIHCGAISNSHAQDNRLWELNYRASTQIADYCDRTDTKLLFISSAAAIDPQTPYGWSKHCAEFYMKKRMTGLNNLNLCILRPFNVWGYDESAKENPSIVYKIMTKQLEHLFLKVQRDFVYVDDVVNAIERAAQKFRAGTFALGTGIATEIIAFYEELIGGEADLPVVWSSVKWSLVANPKHILPGWHPTPISEFYEEIKRRHAVHEA